MPGARDSTPRRALIALIIASACAAAGWFAFQVPYERALESGATTAKNIVDGMQWISLLGIAGIGFTAGLIAPKEWLLWGPCTMAAFPVMAFIEMGRDPTSHNLWPIEFAFYGVIAIPGIAEAWLGAFLRSRFARGRPSS